MASNSYNRHNFHKNTFCVFREVPVAEIANQTPGYKSKSGSSYYFSPDGVYRLSDHWGRAARCKWRLEPMPQPARGKRLGFAHWSSFHRDNETEKLYYIEWSGSGVTFRHLDEKDYNGQLVRTASQTMRRIRQVRDLLADDSWMRYYPMHDAAALQQSVVGAMIASDEPLARIKASVVSGLR